MPFTFEMPERAPDAPPPTTRTPRRIDWPDDEHYVMACGGSSQVEGEYLAYLANQVTRASELRVATLQQPKPSVEDIIAANTALDSASREMNRGYATFLADRVTDHNLVDADGNKLPLGMAFFYALLGRDAMDLCNAILRRPAFFADPKALTPLRGG